MLRIGCVKYLNTAPLVEGLNRLEGVELVRGAPSAMASLLRAGHADVALASTIDLADDSLAALDCGMIGCDGPTLTVRVFSRVPLAHARRLHADTDSRTSVALAAVLLRRLHDAPLEIIPFDARERIAVDAHRRSEGEHPETLLLIGDKVVADPPPNALYPHQLDLGLAWKAWTGLPFVYALWMTRRDLAASPGVARAHALLDRQRRRNALRLDSIATRRAPEHRWPADLAREYLTGLLRFHVGDRERASVARFLDEAASLGLCGRTTTAWIEPASLEPAAPRSAPHA